MMHLDAILIDDDPWVRSDWRDQGRRYSKTIMVVGSLTELMPTLPSIRQDIPVFVDIELGENQSGLDVARHLAAVGMTQIFLTTAHSPMQIESLPFLKGTYGKDPPRWLLTDGRVSQKLSQPERLSFLQGMSSDQKAIFDQRIRDYENALYGVDGSLWLDGIGTHYPDDVMDIWERGIYEGWDDAELKKRIQEAWRESLGI